MEKESIIDRVKHIRYKEPKIYQVYNLVKYNGYTWIVIEANLLFVRLMMKNCLPEEKMKKIFDDDYFFNFDDPDDSNTAINICTYSYGDGDYGYFSDNYIKYSLDKKCSDWNKTEIKRGLNDEFLKEFNKEELLNMRTNYDEDKYSFDYIRIPTVGEIKRLDLNKITPNRCCWTMSSDYDGVWIENVRNCVEFCLNSKSRYGVRPVITIKSDNPNIKKVGRV